MVRWRWAPLPFPVSPMLMKQDLRQVGKPVTDKKPTLLCLSVLSQVGLVRWCCRWVLAFASWERSHQMPMPSPHIVTRVGRVLRPLCVKFFFTVVHFTDRRGQGTNSHWEWGHYSLSTISSEKSNACIPGAVHGLVLQQLSSPLYGVKAAYSAALPPTLWYDGQSWLSTTYYSGLNFSPIIAINLAI